MIPRPQALAAVVLATAVLSACARPALQLPSGPAEPLADPTPVLEAALGHCAGIRTLTAEVSLSGRAGRQKLRGRLLTGLAEPASIRLEGLAPFGAPMFILAASPSQSVLLLPRDDRVLRNEPPPEILAALAGIRIEPDDLRAYMAGCPGDAPAIAGARRFGESWVAVDLPDEGVAYLRHTEAWRLVAVERSGLRVVFEQWSANQPGRIRLQSTESGGASAFDLSLRLSQVERNVDLPANAFTVDVPDDTLPITLEELRQAGPMRDDAARDRTSR